MIHSLVELRGETLHGLFALESSETTKIVNYLTRYEARCLPEPKRSWEDDEFMKRVYERSCIEQLTLLVRLNPNMSFESICDEVVDELTPSYESLDTPPEVFELVSVWYEMVLVLRDWMKMVLEAWGLGPHDLQPL